MSEIRSVDEGIEAMAEIIIGPHIGDEVEMTDDAIAQGLNGAKDRRYGLVIGRSSRPLTHVRVRRDGLKFAETYARKFWKLRRPR